MKFSFLIFSLFLSGVSFADPAGEHQPLSCAQMNQQNYDVVADCTLTNGAVSAAKMQPVAAMACLYRLPDQSVLFRASLLEKPERYPVSYVVDPKDKEAVTQIDENAESLKIQSKVSSFYYGQVESVSLDKKAGTLIYRFDARQGLNQWTEVHSSFQCK